RPASSPAVLSAVPARSAPEVFALSLHDALPISGFIGAHEDLGGGHKDKEEVGSSAHEHPSGQGDLTHIPLAWMIWQAQSMGLALDRKSTRLNSSHVSISYAVFCLKKTRRDGRQP